MAIPAGATRILGIGTETHYLRPAAGGTLKRDMWIKGITIDGNAANQTYTPNIHNGLSPQTFAGIEMAYSDSPQLWFVKVKDWFGTGSTPPNESFHVSTWYCENASLIHVETGGSGSAKHRDWHLRTATATAPLRSAAARTTRAPGTAAPTTRRPTSTSGARRPGRATPSASRA